MMNTCIYDIQDSRFRNGMNDGSLHDNEAKESVPQVTKEVIGYIKDNDFGRVAVYYYPENNVIKADDMVICGVPENYETDMMMYAWGVYKKHYCDYGSMWVSYDQIPELESFYD